MPGGVGHFLNHLGRWEPTTQGIRPPEGETERPRRSLEQWQMANGDEMRLPPEGGQLLIQTHAEFILYGISAPASVQRRDAEGQTQAIGHTARSCEPQRMTTNTKTKTNTEELTISRARVPFVLCPSMLCCNFLWRHRPPPPKAPSPSRQPASSCLPVTPAPSHPDFLCVRRRGLTGDSWHSVFRPAP